MLDNGSNVYASSVNFGLPPGRELELPAGNKLVVWRGIGFHKGSAKVTCGGAVEAAVFPTTVLVSAPPSSGLG